MPQPAPQPAPAPTPVPMAVPMAPPADADADDEKADSPSSSMSRRSSRRSTRSSRESREDEVREVEVVEVVDMGLQLTCSLRSGVGPRELELEKPPDGGARAWLCVLGVHLTVFTTWGFINSFGVFQAYYATTLAASPSTISWIGSIQIFLLFTLGTFTGRALDAGYFFAVYRLGSVLVLLGIFTTSISGGSFARIFLSQGLCCGLGSGLIFCPALALSSTYFRRRRSLALGIGASGSATGGIVIPLVVQTLLPRIGFAWTVRCLGLICTVALLVANVVLKPRLKPRKVGSLVEWKAFREPTYVLFAIGMFLSFTGVYFAFFYASSFARSILSLSIPSSFTTLIIMNAVGLPGRILPNYLADRRLGPLNLLIPITLTVSLLLFVWPAVMSQTGLYIWAGAYGVAAAGIQSLFPATLSSLTTDLERAGTRMGMVFTIVSFACLTGTPVGGALVQAAGGEYWAGQVFAGTCVLLGGLVLAAARVAKTGWKWRVKA
ncbi:major facilitator superfamily domain-containing protein [Tricharina praecox]|uniref:major facilitator superfamily domain-containing protein n=1 Tax=Tricharina praecox TaxID=43433 RepID=UPI00222105A9|nr:major facilitator superfamily domain-containing protein [Tricharina praecox]KAI5842248.1 major facilitator superfamily domain-containing protein [Tricharina praecox]